MPLVSNIQVKVNADEVATVLGANLEEAVATRYVTPEQFQSQFHGETDWAVMINAALDYASSNNLTVLLSKDYAVRSTIKHYSGANLVCTGRIICAPAGNYSVVTSKGNTEVAAYIITTRDGTFNNAKSVSCYGLTLTYTANREPSSYTEPHVPAKGLVITDIANVYVQNLQTFGFLNGGVDVGGVSGSGFEIVLDKSMSWVYAWEDSEAAGFRCNVTDSTFKDVITVAYGIGVNLVKGGGNVFINPHPWGYPNTSNNQYPNRQCKIHFVLTGGGATFIRPYLDTITKVNATAGGSRSNGGFGFYVANWRNKVIGAEALVHSQEASTGLALAYIVGDAARNDFEFSNIGDTSKYVTERVTYDGAAVAPLFVNNIKVPEYAAGNLTGSISLTAAGVTSTGTYNLRRDGEYIDISCTVQVTSIGSVSGALSLTLPRGLTCRFGPTAVPSQASCFGGISSSNVGQFALLNGSTVEFYYRTASGGRTRIEPAGLSTGTLELFLRGRISN